MLRPTALVGRSLRWGARAGVRAGISPARLGYCWLDPESPAAYFARPVGAGERYETIHAEGRARNPLPRNIADAAELPDRRGWWGFSFRDVPRRRAAATGLASCADCRIVAYRDAADGDLFPAIVNRAGRAFALREMAYRIGHAPELRARDRQRRIARATWIAERSYANHSHWLTAHLPKLILLKRRDMLADVLLPDRRSRTIDESLRLLGLRPDDFPAYREAESLAVDELTFFETDRFRPELLHLVRDAFVPAPHPAPWRRVYISRGQAARRRLENEDEIWPLLRAAGFERVLMERLSLAEQIGLMAETALLCAPHGAGLTNMIFCRPGTQVIEIADLRFPNPNFYALAAAMGHGYWLAAGAGIGRGHPLDRHMRVDPDRFGRVLAAAVAAPAPEPDAACASPS